MTVIERAHTGAAVRTIVRGRTVFADGKVIGTPGWGTLIRPLDNHAN